MRIEFTSKVIFGFDGPNISFLGNIEDFRKLSELILDLMDPNTPATIELNKSDYLVWKGEEIKLFLISKKSSNNLALLNNNELVFELDARYWERIFRYFVLMSWYKRTYYLNAYENCLNDFDLKQDCNFICSSEF